jgi:hypothetical protein
VQQVMLVHGGNVLQIGVFAAPNGVAIWDDVRAEIRIQMTEDGTMTEEIDGEFGVELRSSVNTSDGQTNIRVVGVDGPGWMLRAVYQNAAAVDPEAAELLSQVLRGLVVNPGVDSLPPRTPLPMRVPPGAMSRAQSDKGDERHASQMDSGEAPPSE